MVQRRFLDLECFVQLMISLDSDFLFR